MLTTGTNLMARQSARQLGIAHAGLSDSVRRLASGQRIVSAKDDAAGLAVRELLRSDIAVTRQSSRNASDAVSMIQTAEGGAGQINELLLRMKSLAEQAASETYSDAQREILDAEFQQLAEEITRVADNTEFNGLKLLNDDATYNVHLGGKDQDGTIAVQATDLSAHGLDISGTRSTARLSVGVQDPHDKGFMSTTSNILHAIVVRFDTDGDLWAPFYSAGDKSMYDLVDAFNQGAREPITGKVNYTDPPWQGPDDFEPARVVYDETDKLYYVEIRGYTKGEGNNVYEVFDGTGQGWHTGDWERTNGEGTNREIDTQTKALEALNKLDDALEMQSSAQARLGYTINRLEWSSRVLDIEAENLLASESRISDVDVARETARMTRQQVLTQAGISMLTQANTMPEMALQLLN
jgi:flagellin